MQAGSCRRACEPRPLRRMSPCKRGAPSVNGLSLGTLSGALMRAFLDVLLLILQLYTYVIIAAAILSWLVAFNVVNRYNEVVRSIWNLVTALTEPLLRPIRGMVPNFGGIDISPVILLLGIFFLERVIWQYIYPNVF
jgi:YggT family protein